MTAETTTGATLTPNAPLLLATMTYIEEHPEEHDQEIWWCGTAGCFAGHAVRLDGGKFAEDDSATVYARDDDPAACVWRPFYESADAPMRITVRARARHALGLSEEQADGLFAAENTPEDLREIVTELTEGCAA